MLTATIPLETSVSGLVFGIGAPGSAPFPSPTMSLALLLEHEIKDVDASAKCEN
jgi:hypothetical protein